MKRWITALHWSRLRSCRVLNTLVVIFTPRRPRGGCRRHSKPSDVFLDATADEEPQSLAHAPTADFIAHLHSLDLKLSLDGEQLQVSAPTGMLTQPLRNEIAIRKQDILAWLRTQGAGRALLTDVSRTAGLQTLPSLPEQGVWGKDSCQPAGGVDAPAAHHGLQGAGPTRLPRQGDLPLSFAQQRLWFLAQLDPGTSAYTIAIRRRLRGPLDVTALTNACTALVRRHEALRTTFVSKDGQPVQRIANPDPVTLGIRDLEQYDVADHDRAAERVVGEETQRPFDLARGPLFRPVLLRFGPEEHELLVAVHHIVADGWSLDILARELETLYATFAAGCAASLPDLPLQYADFALWQRQWLAGDVLQTQRLYWLEHLRGQLTPLKLPTDHPRLQPSAAAGASYTFVLPPELPNQCRAFGRQQGATLFMTLLAAFKALLARYTGQEDIVVGTPVANRNYVELESVVGFFANTLVLRTDLGGDPTFRELLSRVRETCLGAYSHPDMPFEKLVEELQPERSLGQNPLFQVSFVWQGAATGGGLQFVTVAAPFDLTLFVHDNMHEALSVTIRYRNDLFEPETIVRLVNHYCTLLEGAVAAPDRRISELPLLSHVETQRLLMAYNATAVPYPDDRSVPGLFEEQADATPEAIALECGETSLTYCEVDRRANRLAHVLCSLGVGPEHLVGLWMERSADTIIAILGILKARAAYVPFDLLAPPKRLAFMLRDTQVSLLLTQKHLLARLPTPRPPTLCLDVESDQIMAQPETRLNASINADSLAYVMYTSGSTGEPKGVAVTHKNIIRLVENTDYAHFGPKETFLQFTALSFDASTFEIWGALLHGSRLVIAPPGMLSAEELGAILVHYGVTTLWLTAGLFHQIVEHRITSLAPLRQLLTGGDVLSPAHVQRVLTELPHCRLINGYGPTEATTFTCCYTVTPSLSLARSVPIGRPLANTRVYVLDRYFRPVPVGVPGELWIAGDGLARGYWNRPALTAERFVVRRLSDALEERLYRSGDLVRWLHDGTLEFLGRLDSQVKIRGYRVELGEVEATLAQHPSVREVAVVARTTADGEKGLVAYITGTSTCNARDLREFLRSKLPEYMLPAMWMTLDSLPLTDHGKVDRQALPEPQVNIKATDTFVPPRDDLERQLARIWQDTLSLDSVGIHENFFDLGGHSLLAVRMFARMEEQLQVTLPLATLFQAPSIAGLASLICKGRSAMLRHSLVPIQPVGSRLPIFGMPGVGGNVLGYHLFARLMGPEQPFYGLQSRGLDGLKKPLTRIEDIAREFLREIREVQPEGPYHLMGMCMGGVVAYEMAQQLRANGQEVGLLALLETWAPEVTLKRPIQSVGHPTAVLRFIGTRLRLYAKGLAQLRGDERLHYLLSKLRLVMEILLQRSLFRGARGEFYQAVVTQANLLAFQQYKPCPYPGPVVLFRAEGRQVRPCADSRLAWHTLAAGGLEVYSIPSEDSGQMLTEPYARVVASQLKACLARFQTAPSPARSGL